MTPDTQNLLQKEQTKQKRLPELSYLNVLFCIMVICVHILSEPVTMLDKLSIQYFVTYTPWKLFQFVTQGFVFLSGLKLFIKDRSDMNAGRFYLERAKRVLLPYLLWVIIYYLYFIWIGWYSFSLSELFHYIIAGDLVAHFYFVIIIAQMYLLTPLLAKLFKKCSVYIILVYSLFISVLFGQYLPHVLSIISPDINLWYNDRLFTTYIFYFIAGAAVGINYDIVICKLREAKALIYSSFVFFSLANLVLSYISISAKAYIHWCDTLHFAYSVSAILASLTFAKGFADKHKKLPKPISSFIKAADSSSYMLYLSHILVILIVRLRLDNAVSDIGIRLLVTVFALALFTVAASIIWTYLKKTVKYRRI